jgi:hypothetical protein
MWGSVLTRSPKARTLVLCLSLALASLPLFAGGQAEPALTDVQKLMQQKDYTGALRLLVQIQTAHPEMQDQTQALIAQIFNVRQQYNAVLKDLTQALDSQDEAKLEVLTTRLADIDPQQSMLEVVSARGFLKFLHLLDQAAALLADGKDAEALSLYLLPLTDPVQAGFDMQKPDFESAKYGQIVMTSVREATLRATAAASQEVAAAGAITAISRTVDDFLATKATPDSPTRFDAVLEPLRKAAMAEGTVHAAAEVLSNVSKSIHGPSGRADSYIQYLLWLLIGREGKSEGMAKAIHDMWESRAQALPEKVAANASEAFKAAVTQYDAGKLDAAASSLDDAYYRNVVAVKAAALPGAAVEARADNGWSVAPATFASAQKLLTLASASQENAEEVAAFQALLAGRKHLSALPDPAGAAAQTVADSRASAQATADDAEAKGMEWIGRSQAWTAKAGRGVDVAAEADSAISVSRRFTSLANDLRQKDLSYALVQAGSETAPFAPAFASAVQKRLQGQDLMNGTVKGTQLNANAPRNPQGALTAFDSAAAALNALARDVDSFRSRWRAEKPWVVASAQIAAIAGAQDALRARIAAEQSELSRLTDVAVAQHQEAIGKRKLGEVAFAVGAKALQGKQYDNAKLQLGDARSLYLDSLLQEEDPGVRARYETEIPNLLKQIDEALLGLRLDEVDKLVADARRLFNGGRFLNAFITLQNADDKWRSIKGDEANRPLDLLMAQVRTALQASGGRDLAPEDPRTPYVNSFISLATLKASGAEKLAKTDPTRKSLLEDASANVQSALDLAPVYRLAKALQLRIKRLQAPTDQAFVDEASSEVSDVMKAYRAKTLSDEKVYFALKDYQDIVPAYPGLKDTVAQLEISLGFREKPISPTDLGESTSQYAQAAALYNPANSLTYRPALDMLDRALSLNPNNAQASALRRSIFLRQGSAEVAALSPVDTDLFAQARRYYLNGDWGNSFKILDGLISKDKKNQNYPPLADLYLSTKQKLGL